MNIKDILSTISSLIVIIGAVAGLFVFFRLAPVLSLRINPRWTDETRQFLLVRYEVENKSRVRVQSLIGHVQMFEHILRPGGSLSHYIPFTKEGYEEENYGLSMSDDRPEWHEPTKIFKSTKQIYPGETIVIEKLYPCSQAEVVVHLGLQVGFPLSLWGRIATRKREPWRQTTSCMLVGRHIG